MRIKYLFVFRTNNNETNLKFSEVFSFIKSTKFFFSSLISVFKMINLKVMWNLDNLKLHTSLKSFLSKTTIAKSSLF